MLFFAGDFFAVLVFFAGLLFFAALEVELFLAAVDFAALDFFAGALFFAVLVVFLAVDFAGALFFAVLEVFLAVDFAGALFFAVDFLEALLFFAAVDFAALLFFAAVDFAAVDFLAAVELAAAFLPVVFLAAPEAALRVSLGSFFAPETTAFRSAPGLNFGTAVFLALIRSPVRGLRTHRASRTRFSKEPNPVIATFSPRATSRVMVSSTDSSACAAALRLPS